jgi:methylase of polypeptide subunit release factors
MFHHYDYLSNSNFLLRPETASSVSHLLSQFRLVREQKIPRRVRILDLCCGTGCISLLSAHSFPYKSTGVNNLQVLGVDLSPSAVALSRQNRRKVLNKAADSEDEVQRRAISNTMFSKADIFEDQIYGYQREKSEYVLQRDDLHWDILISNPPYISPSAFDKTTSHSVRKFEPKLALVPSIPQHNPIISDKDQGDLFYPRLLEIANLVCAKLFLVEVADMAQAERVAMIANERGTWDGIEIWCDEPSLGDEHEAFGDIKVLGQGHGRSVFCWRGAGGTWIGKD